MVKKSTVERVAEVLRNSPKGEPGAWLLVGAGCSVEAGIPLARDIINDIQKKHPAAYDATADKSYSACMEELNPGERKRLFRGYVEGAKINWAHIAIACLMKAGYVDKVLTTNFDNLIVRACSLLNFFPAVYDIPQTRNFNTDEMAEQAVVHLHGQVSGFSMLNTNKDLQDNDGKDDSLFSRMANRSPGIVVGYSGENDFVFRQLADRVQFSHGLYWVGYKEDAPAKHVRDELLEESEGAYFVEGFDADSFFVQLAQELNVFPPSFLEKPFSHLLEVIDGLAEFDIAESGKDTGVVDFARERIQKAVEDLETESYVSKIKRLYMAGAYEEALTIFNSIDDEEESINEARHFAALSNNRIGLKINVEARFKFGEEGCSLYRRAAMYFNAALELEPEQSFVLANLGVAFCGQARTGDSETADTLFPMAIENFRLAHNLKPENHVVVGNWGRALAEQAESKKGTEAQALFAKAAEKFTAAHEIRPDDSIILNNWGRLYHSQAKSGVGSGYDDFFDKAIEKFLAALELNPDGFVEFNNWAMALVSRARARGGADGDDLIANAFDLYEKANNRSPDSTVILINWGFAYYEMAVVKFGSEAFSLYSKAIEKFEESLALEKNNYLALCYFGLSLAGQARAEKDEIADKLFARAFDKYSTAIGNSPEDYLAIAFYAHSLTDQASMKSDGEADKLYSVAMEKYLGVEKKEKGRAAYYMAEHFALKGEFENCLTWLNSAFDAEVLPPLARISSNVRFDSVRDEAWFTEFLAKSFPDEVVVYAEE